MCPDKILLSRFYDKDLERSEMDRIRNHLAECGSCGEYVDALGEQSRLIHAVPIPSSSDKEARILDRILHGRTMWSRNRTFTFHLPVPIAAAAVLLFFFMTGLLLSRQLPFSGGADPGSPMAGGELQENGGSRENLDELLVGMKHAGFFDEVEMDIPFDMDSDIVFDPELTMASTAYPGGE